MSSVVVWRSCVPTLDSLSKLFRAQLDLGVSIRAILLTTIPDSTSQKFLVLGTLSRSDSNSDGRYATVFLDFAPLQNRKCDENDFEKWYARSEEGKECLMGHKVSLMPIFDSVVLLLNGVLILVLPRSNGTDGESPLLPATSVTSSRTQ